MLKKVYIETTVPSFYYNQRREPEMVAMMHWTRDWWDHHRVCYDVVSSPAVIQELGQGDHPQRNKKLALMQDVPMLEVTEEVVQVAEVYIARKVMPQDPAGDALHLALASVHECDILLTWNCLHLANANKFSNIQRVNALLGLKTPVLATPFQLMQEDETDEHR